MNILMQCRNDAFTKRGGDTIQMEKPIPFLKKMGVVVTISTDQKVNLTDYDLVHLVGITRVHETYSQLKNALRYNKPIVLTPMYNSRKDYELYIKQGYDSLVSLLYKMFPFFDLYQKLRAARLCVINRNYQDALKQFILGYEKQQQYVLKNTTMLIPNSPMELSAINEELNFTGMNNMIVHSGVEIEKELLNVSPDLFYSKYKVKDFVLVMGRIEPLKNQVKLMEAMKNVDIPVVFSGALTQEHFYYCNRFLKLIESRKNFHYLGFINRRMLYSGIRNARVIAAPSWFEILGFTALEGGLMGIKTVITDRGFGRHYFLNDVWYCNPNDTTSIRDSIINAFYSSTSGDSFRKRILNKYTWEKSSITLFDAYKKALNFHNNCNQS
jgi:glycosyltransferase involved in cell wall biosynthesis